MTATYFDTSEVPDSERLSFRRPKVEDARFYLNLTRDPDYKKFIKDVGLQTLKEAEVYVREKPIERFNQFGVGIWIVEEKSSGKPVGTCGVIFRKELDHADLGYAFLSEFRGKGFGSEAGQAVLEFSRNILGLGALCAIVHPDNIASEKLLKKIGFVPDGQRMLSEIGEISDYYHLEF